MHLMSFIAEHMGHTEKGEEFAREARANNRDPSRRVSVGQRLAFALLATGKFEESAMISLGEMAWVKDVGIHPKHIAFLNNNLARAYIHLGKFDEGRRLAEETVGIWKESHGFEQPFLLRTVARAVLAQGEPKEARRLIQQTVESQQQMGNENLFALSGAYIDAAYPALALGNLDEARQMLVQGLTYTHQSGAFDFSCKGFPAAALLLATQNRLEEAAFLNGAIQRYPHLTGSCWYATVALDRLTELLAPLPTDVRAAAEERGRVVELPEMTTELLAILS